MRRSLAITVVLVFAVCLTADQAMTASPWQASGQATPPASAKDVEAQAAALCDTSDALQIRAQYREARDFGLRCLELYERLSLPAGIGRANLLLNVAADLSGDYAAARLRATAAIAAFESIGDRDGRARATLNLLRTSTIVPAEAERLAARAVEDARSAGNRTIEASALHSWGDRLFSRGQYEESFDKLERAAGLYEQVGDRLGLGTVFNSLGRLYRAHGQLEEALRFQLKALDLHQAAGQPLQLMQSLNAVAVVHGMLGHASEARGFYERALVVAEQSSSPRIQDFLRANIASLLDDQGEFARAASMLETVIANGVDSYPSLRQGQLSNARLKLGQPREALAAAEKGLALCGTAVNDCISALRHRARAEAALGNQAAALNDVTDALNRIEGVRKQLVPADFFKQEFHRARDSIYSEAIALSLGEKQETRALETAELARARSFADLLAARAIEPNGSSVVFRGPSGAASGTSGLRSTVSAPAASAGDIERTAARLGSTFLLYWVADDELTEWVVTPDGVVRTRRVAVLRSRLDELVRATTPLTESGAAGMPSTAAWRELYALLVQPIRDALPRTTGSLITIVPHGPLLSLSFAALQDARGRYLLEDYTIHYAPAASVLQFTSAQRPASGRTGDLLLVADPSLPTRSKLERPLARLPGARAEAAAIARLVPKERVTILRDTLATEGAVRAAASGKAVVHFATHAIVRDDDPFGSFLAMGPESADADRDGLLTAQEVYVWHLDADMVVLSACRSAGGRVTGDGVATFARAFIYAGTPSLVASLWDVADEPANRLLPGFYRAWLGGQSKARALRTAQLQLLRDLRAGKVQLKTPAGLVTLPEHPVFWAGFVLIGEPK
jgi:CHAT domain-containing protein